MNLKRMLAVGSLTLVMGAGGVQSVGAHGGHHHHHHHGGGHHHHHGGEHHHYHGGGDHHHHHHDNGGYWMFPDGNGGVFHTDGARIRHCRPEVSVDNPLVCSEWQ